MNHHNESYSGLKLKKLPADKCVICNKSIDEVGGRRIVAQKHRGVALSNTYRGGGNPELPSYSIRLYDNSDGAYVHVWGELKFWSQVSIQRAKDYFLHGLRPWLCQICAARTCSECGHPINMPMGSDVVYESGCTSHVPIFPFNPGCINLECVKYRLMPDTSNDS